MKKLTEKRAAELAAAGITHIASIAKSHFSTEYFKIATLAEILENGGKMPEYQPFDGFVHGVNGRKIDWSTCVRWCKL